MLDAQKPGISETGIHIYVCRERERDWVSGNQI